MFDIGFSELLVVSILTLIIFGPERLPEVIRTITLWVGRFKRSYRKIREDIEREVGVEDIKRQLYNEEIMQSLNETKAQIKKPIDMTQDTLRKTEAASLNRLPDTKDGC